MRNITESLVEKASRLFAEGDFKDCQSTCVQAFKSSFLALWNMTLHNSAAQDRRLLERMARKAEEKYRKPINRLIFGEWAALIEETGLMTVVARMLGIDTPPLDDSALARLARLREDSYRSGETSETAAGVFLDNLKSYLAVSGPLLYPEGQEGAELPTGSLLDMPVGGHAEGVALLPPETVVQGASPDEPAGSALSVQEEIGFSPAAVAPAPPAWGTLAALEKEMLGVLDTRLRFTLSSNFPLPAELGAWGAFFSRVAQDLEREMEADSLDAVRARVRREVQQKFTICADLEDFLTREEARDPDDEAAFRRLRRLSVSTLTICALGILEDVRALTPERWVRERFPEFADVAWAVAGCGRPGADPDEAAAVRRWIDGVLRQAGCEILPVEAGKTPFDPVRHVCAASVRQEGFGAGVVTEVLAFGFRESASGQVVRPAQVAVNQA